jgi:hypothetical protein
MPRAGALVNRGIGKNMQGFIRVKFLPIVGSYSVTNVPCTYRIVREDLPTAPYKKAATRDVVSLSARMKTLTKKIISGTMTLTTQTEDGNGENKILSFFLKGDSSDHAPLQRRRFLRQMTYRRLDGKRE